MKKTLLTLAAGAFLLSFASCKKDYTCTCTISSGGQNFGTSTISIENSSKGDAKDKCPESTTVTSAGVSATQTCDLND